VYKRQNLHGLASSPDGSRLAVSIAEPDGSRGLWGIRLGPDGAGPLPLLRHRVDVAEERSASWVDEETLAWTSYEGGIANVRTARWPEGADSLTGARLRTKTGIGADLAGVRDDSLLVVDRSTRLRFPVRAAAATTRRGTGGDLPRDPYPFPSGRAVAPLLAESVSVAATAEGPFPYRALREVRPWFLLPLLGPQAGSLGFGGLAIASEPLLRHSIGAYVYGSPESYRDPDRAAAYLTGRFGPWLAAYHHSTILPRRVLRGGILWERREQTGIGVLAPLQSSADPNRGGWIALAVDADSRWPRFDAAALRTPLGAPRAWSGVRASIEAGTVHQPPPARGNVATGISVRVDGSLAALEHQERFLRAAARFFHAAPLPFAPSRLYLEGSFNGVSGPGRSGGLPPQEYLGLDRYPSYDAGVPGLDLDGTVFLRGWPRERAARAVLYGDLEIRMPVLPDIVIRGPGFAIGAGTLAPFLEAAHP
ncbi:MAG: hypothetical protein QUU85_18860, partial [Candidatus Eisenbacteria bacterium]|nr:hypothetical protein [Candidatus Eisenbacteria bacterium]